MPSFVNTAERGLKRSVLTVVNRIVVEPRFVEFAAKP